MNIEQIYTGCLAQGAYYITSNGEAAIIDPLREVQPYLDKLEKDNVKLKYIFETHFHADFVSGHLSLSKKTNAPIVYGPTAEPNYDVIVAEDNQEFKVGNVTIVALHTPGHTMESTTYLLRDENGKDVAIFSGDTLFLGDVGRPDLAQKGNELTSEMLAGILYDSLRNRIMPLADDITVYPGHGAGSACGKNMSKETVDTLGNQKATNYALRADMTKEEFIEAVLDGIAEPPAYFPMNVQMNKSGYDDFDEVKERGLKALSPKEFELVANQNEALVLDVRNQKTYSEGHIPKSIFIGLKGQFAPWVGALIKDVKQPILLVTEEGQEEEAVTRLARVGFDNVLGFLKGGFNAWKEAGKETDTVTSINAEEFAEIYKSEDIPVFDVRKDGEFTSQHVEKAEHTPLSNLNDHLAQFPKEKTFYIHCQGGYRSMIAASILKSRGYHNFIDIAGGFKDIAQTGIVTKEICPLTGEPK
ncbi:MBL fold metallo-hydrolase [Weeksellaceae bacterium KMM 9713]|uniref:MBL fold metallo-hydrolase n=1 Tax=Profundicola chukchiensis TaxID=2961959 RepID=A0A9X4MZJ6_9FLAO|nr:MBL fold metallo-hydrolase [Profundicola chukchiensis]MDG4945842.1 MBL fold metallo-hydrolase [Profundicola chukchiensis]